MILVLIPMWGMYAKENVQLHSSMHQSGLSLSYTLTANKLSDLPPERNLNEDITTSKKSMLSDSTSTANNEAAFEQAAQLVPVPNTRELQPMVINTTAKSSLVVEEDNFGLASLLILLVGLIIAGILRMLMVT